MKKNVTFFLFFIAADQISKASGQSANSPQRQSQPTYNQSSVQYDQRNNPSYSQGNSYRQQDDRYYYQSNGQPSSYRTNTQPGYYRNGQLAYNDDPTMNAQPNMPNQQQSRMNAPNQGGPMVDQDIGKKIRELLTSGQFAKGYEDLNYSVQNGYVILKGYANSTDNRNKIEETVRGIPGVRDVDNRIFLDRNSPTFSQKIETAKAPNDQNGPVSDQALINSVQEQLSSNWFTKNFKDVTVTANFGVVELGGTVDTQNDKDKIEETVKKTNGVKQVNNKITVKEKADSTKG